VTYVGGCSVYYSRFALLLTFAERCGLLLGCCSSGDGASAGLVSSCWSPSAAGASCFAPCSFVPSSFVPSPFATSRGGASAGRSSGTAGATRGSGSSTSHSQIL